MCFFTRSCRQLVAGVSFLVLVLAICSEALHYVLIPHSVCAAHGELIHGEAPEPGHAGEGLGTTVKLAEHSEHSHDPCGVFSSRKKSFLPQCIAPLTGIAANAPSCDPSHGFVFSDPKRLLLASPKNSPPSLG